MFLQNAIIEYKSELLHDNSNNNKSRKLNAFVEYENSLNKSDSWIKFKITVCK